MRNNKRADPVPIETQGKNWEAMGRSADLAQEIRRRCVDEPTLRFPELLRTAKVGRSKAFELMNSTHRNFDPDFPIGFSLFDSPRSPKVWYRHEVMAWVDERASKKSKFQKGNVA